MSDKLKLYHYWRSSASWRVRFAFAFKNIPCEFVAIDLLKGEQRTPAHLARNPLGTVPVLELAGEGGPKFLGESLAIIEWAEENYPDPSLLPGDSWQRGRIRQLSEVINSGIQPLHNRKVALRHSENEPEQKKWNEHWIREGLGAYEKMVRETGGKFSAGDCLTMADVCLVPQCYSALRNAVELTAFPVVERIYAEALKTQACQASHPDRFRPL